MSGLTQEQHAAVFGRVAHAVQKVAADIVNAESRIGLDLQDVARIFCATATTLLLAALGRDGTATYLRDLAGEIERYAPPTTN